MSEFGSVFAPALEAMLNYRAALGFSRKTYEAKLRGFDRYCSECGLSEAYGFMIFGTDLRLPLQ